MILKMKLKVKIKRHALDYIYIYYNVLYFECYLIADSFDISIGVPDRHFKIKKNKSDIETLPKEEVINCSCASNQEDGLMIQVRIKQFNYIFYFLLILFNITLFRYFNLHFSFLHKIT